MPNFIENRKQLSPVLISNLRIWAVTFRSSKISPKNNFFSPKNFNPSQIKQVLDILMPPTFPRFPPNNTQKRSEEQFKINFTRFTEKQTQLISRFPVLFFLISLNVFTPVTQLNELN